MPVKINGSSSGSVTLQAPASGSDVTVTLPAATGTLLNEPGAWTAWTPSISGTGWALGNATVTGRQSQIGKITYVQGAIVFGSTSTFGSGPLAINLPVNMQSAIYAAQLAGFNTWFYDASTANSYIGTAVWAGSAGAARPAFQNASLILKTMNTTDNAPVAVAASDELYFSFIYEAA